MLWKDNLMDLFLDYIKDRLVLDLRFMTDFWWIYVILIGGTIIYNVYEHKNNNR